MSTAKRGQIPATVATEALLRVAETGNTDQLEDILANGADINGRNAHGMTALMQAAYHGRLEMVRALIAHGADPNATRSDKFTPLLIAAFFGHTEIVRILVDHGAETNAVTRFGTSAPMWAIARTFDEVARYLEKDDSGPTNVEATSAAGTGYRAALPTADPAPLAHSDQTLAAPIPTIEGGNDLDSLDQKAQPSSAPPAVKTLKDPPEIWDLVHEEPRHFDARSAFVARLKSMNTSFVLGTLAVLLLISGCAFAVLTWSGAKARNDADAQAQPQGLLDHGTTASTKSTPGGVGDGGDKSIAPSGAEPDNSVLDSASRNHLKPENVSLGDTPKRTASPSASAAVLSDENGKGRVSAKLRRVTQRSKHYAGNGAERDINSGGVQAAPPTDASSQSHLRPSAEVTERKASAPLSPQLIAPAKNSPSKAKVIQWP